MIGNETDHIKNDFLANMSHELRTPVNAIIGFAELMQSEKVGSLLPLHKEFMSDILSSAKHLLQLINEILDLSKIESGKMEFYPELINLNELVQEVTRTLGALLAEKQMTLDIRMDPTLVSVLIDPNKLKQVLYNYLSNAIKFSSEGGKISIFSHHDMNGFFRLAVQDNGIGISKDKICQLFLPFQQLDMGGSQKYEGTGLGLALTRRIVEAQGGRVDVKSERGEGSTFSVILPCAPIHDEMKVT